MTKKEQYDIEMTDPVPLNEQMKEGLAQVYANEGFRTFIENWIRKGNLVATKLLDIGEIEKAQRYANRIQVLRELLLKGRDQYINFEKIRKAK